MLNDDLKTVLDELNEDLKKYEEITNINKSSEIAGISKLSILEINNIKKILKIN
jgi:hypothetical protein